MESALQRALDDARAGRLSAGIAGARRVLAVKPSNADAMQVLALLLSQAGQLEQAAAQLARAVELSPGAAHLRNNYANVLIQLRRYEEAAAQAEKAVELNGAYGPGYMALSCARLYLPDSEGAIQAARRGLEILPGSPELSKNLVLALDQAGRAEEAIEEAERAHRLWLAAADLHSLFLMLLNYTDRGAGEIAAAHRRFGELHQSGSGAAVDRDPDRKIRVGILSADLRTHSVAFFLEPLMEHVPDWAELACFSLSPTPSDPTTQRLRALSASWEEVGHLDDAALAGRLAAARVDVLLDLMGHTGGNRLGALASKPAPVVITAIGYPNTTGLGAVDYRLVDSITDPAGVEALATERLIRIDPCFLCYRPPVDAPLPAMPSAESPVTFGSFNAPAKIGDRAAVLWRAALDAVPGSRLVLKSKDLSEACPRAAVISRLERAGIAGSRVTVLPAAATVAEHLACYSQVHIALDTVPYNGTTTTCEALWMGVPVVTLEGDRHASRVGASLLTAAGCGGWVAATKGEFAVKAANLARDIAGLAELRRGLRASVAGSVLGDAPAYASRFYSALRRLWREECSRRSAT